jgi:uncharacterized membrane-anchored protein YjiN (DUF445 family)
MSADERRLFMQDISPPPGAADAQKLAALRRVKALATGMLVLCLAVFLGARSYEASVPALAYVAAFAEAAMIGGLADWYAVVALFRRPLGLPIPHTAIIPSNQVRLADNLGHFVEANFLAPEPVRAKLREVDFAELVADWLAEPRRADALSAFVARLVPQAIGAVEGSGLKDFVARRVGEQLDKIEIAPLAAQLLTSLTDEGRHQRILDEIVRVMGSFLTDEQALDALRDKIRDELPTLARVFRADAYLLKKIVASAGSFLEEVKADRDHPVRAEFDRFVDGFLEDLATSKTYAQRIEKMKRDVLARPELGTLAGNVWTSLRTFIEEDAKAEDSGLRRHLSSLFVDVGRQLAADPAIRADMNAGFVVALASFVENQKSGVSRFIADQVKGWDLGQLTHLIELNVGRDLQFIRFNGMLVGGLAGLALHVGEVLVFGN